MYYAGLKIFLDWPESLFTWDILFLIPVTWVSPVLAPVLCSLCMIAMALFFDFRISVNNLNKLEIRELVLMFSGATVIYFTFTVDFGMMIINGHFLQEFFSLTENRDFIKLLTTWEPVHYHWGFFMTGIALICASIFLINKRSIKSPG
jgi:hypothetical protein